MLRTIHEGLPIKLVHANVRHRLINMQSGTACQLTLHRYDEQGSRAAPINVITSPPLKAHQSGSGKYLIRKGVRDWWGFDELEQFGRMENTNWLILGFRSQKCKQFFLGTRNSDFGPFEPQSTLFVITTGTGYGYIHFLSTLRIHSQEGGIFGQKLAIRASKAS